MKNKLMLRLCLMIVVVLSFNSCRQDIFPEQESYHNTSAFQLKSSRVSLDEAKHKAKLLPELEQVENELKAFSKNDAHGRVINYANGVSIDTDDVTYIENGPNFHTYTFNLTRENALPTDPVENLVLIPTADGTYRELLVSYNLTAQEKQTMMNGGLIDTKGKTSITELAKGTYAPLSAGLSCGYVTEQMWGMCSSGDHGISNAGQCEFITNPPRGQHPPQLISIVVYRCTFIGTGTETGGGGEYYGPGGGTDSGTGGNTQPGTTEPCNGNGVATNPLDPNTNIGEGGCSGIPTVVTVPSTKTPCEKIVKVGKDSVTKNTMKDLKTKVNDNKEHIYLLWENNAGVLQDDIHGTGPVNGGGINFSFNSGDKFSAVLHSHYDRPDMLSIFSFDDFITVCNLVYFNAIKDQDSFVMGVVTASGTQYMMVIDDPTKLASFASQIFVNGVYSEENAKMYERFYNDAIYSTNTIANNEVGLALFLESQDIGLKLMKGDDQMENWQQFTKNKQGNIVPVNCN